MKDKIRRFGWKQLLVAVLALCMGLTAFAFVGCGPSEGGEKEVESISVKTMPTKVEYTVGETFTVEGGEITVTYTDGSTETKKMTDEGVTTSNVTIAVNSGISEVKTVTVRYGGKSTTFKITVSLLVYDVTFDWCYEGDQDVTQSVDGGDTVRRPETTPTRDGFTFVNWFMDDKYTIPFDFSTKIEADTTVYALWTDDSKTYFDVTFDYNYAGAPDGNVQKIETGKTANTPAVDPVRTGYTFNGWYADADGETKYDFSTVITAATTVYASWTRTSTGEAQEYVFEAEDTDLAGKSGPGLSGTASGPGMIQSVDTNVNGAAMNASNGRFVGYQYETGCSLTFSFISDMEVSDAKIVLRLSAEMRDMVLDSSVYQIEYNYEQLDYSPISFTGVPTQEGASDVSALYALPFQDFVILENATINEGKNYVTITVNNDVALEGTTIKAMGPLVDCLKITTTAILDWDSSAGLPAENY